MGFRFKDNYLGSEELGSNQVQEDRNPSSDASRLLQHKACRVTQLAKLVGSLCIPQGAKVRRGFTLAEVLITLGIIGVVAAMTLPTLIQKQTNAVVETRLKKFYSNINQAMLMAEAEYGDKSSWYQWDNTVDKDEDGNVIQGNSKVEKWYRKYLYPYMKTIKIEDDESGCTIFYFADGSALKATQPTHMQDWVFYPGNPEKCIQKYGSEAGGRCAFAFIYMPNGNNVANPPPTPVAGWQHHFKKGFEPYKYGWDGTYNGFFSGGYSGCDNTKRSYCTALIQYNGWKIPKDYPFKISY